MIEIIGYILIITLWIFVYNLKSTNRKLFRAGDVVKVGKVKVLLNSYDSKNHTFNSIDEQGQSYTITEEAVKFLCG